MTELSGKMCNTINQNMVEPYISDYFKTFGTLFNNNIGEAVGPRHLSVKLLMNDESNLSSTSDFSDADIEFSEVQDAGSSSGKISNHTASTFNDTKSVSKLESCLESSYPPTCSRSPIFNVPCCVTTLKDDTWDSDFDLEKFEREQSQFRNKQTDETASLSDFHNVSKVIQKIRIRLESFLEANQENPQITESAGSKQTLQKNIVALKTELESYLQAIEARKEQELRQFSENMINEERLSKMKNAFQRKEKLQSNFYETLGSKNYAIANNNSIPRSLRYNRDTIHVRSGFTMRNCYDNDYAFGNFSEDSSVEFFTMLINEDKSEVLNSAPKFSSRERVSLIFRDPEEVIKQWQNYQLQTTKFEHKQKPLQAKVKPKSVNQEAVWGFTLSSYQNHTLQLKLRKEHQTRLYFRVLFYILLVVLFVIVVISTEAMFNFERKTANNF